MRRRPTRTICLAVLGAAALFPVAPQAGDVQKTTFQGDTATGKVYFELFSKRAEPVKVGKVLVTPLALECAEGRPKISIYRDTTEGSVSIRNSKFRATSGFFQQILQSGGEVGVTGPRRPFTGSFAGVLAGDAKTASGKLDFGDPVDLSSELTDCDTGGPQSWKAKVNTRISIDRRVGGR